MSDKMQTGLGLDSVKAAIELLEAAKRMGVQTFRLGDFQVSFSADAVLPGGAPYRVPAGPAEPQYSNPLEDPDMWLHVQEPPK